MDTVGKAPSKIACNTAASSLNDRFMMPIKPISKKLQMVDIARLAGVSVSTVSRALNGSELINPETTKRVQELARKLNYSINIGAKNLRIGENRTVSIVIPFDRKTRQTISDPFFLGMLGSLADALTELGYDMLLSRVDADHLDKMAEVYDTGRARGIIVIGQWGHHDQLNLLASRQVPFVVWGANLPRQLYCSVGSDNVSGGQVATTHLLEQGLKRIVFLGNAELPEVAQRYQGYLLAHKLNSMPLFEELQVNVSFSAQQAKEGVDRMLDCGLQFDAIFAASDLIAMTAISVLQSRGLRVPADIAVVGYDDIDAAGHFHPPVTTVRQSIDTAGNLLVNALSKVINGELVEPILIPTHLVVRESSLRHLNTVSR
jgi:DNA-binding LacI/PurR family transcriptional regulator